MQHESTMVVVVASHMISVQGGRYEQRHVPLPDSGSENITLTPGSPANFEIENGGKS